MKYAYTSVFSEKDGKVYARVPDLAGCITTGDDLADAIEEMEDALAGWLCVAEDEVFEVPAPSEQRNVPHEGSDILSVIKADTSLSLSATRSTSSRLCATARSRGSRAPSPSGVPR